MKITTVNELKQLFDLLDDGDTITTNGDWNQMDMNWHGGILKYKAFNSSQTQETITAFGKEIHIRYRKTTIEELTEINQKLQDAWIEFQSKITYIKNNEK